MTIDETLPQATRHSLVDTAITLLRAQIEGGAWKVGERIPKELELAEMLRVGRNTVREAIRVLSHAEVLEVRQGDGTYVLTNLDPTNVMRRVNRSSLREHLELRTILETEAARLAAQHRTKSDVVQLRRLLKARGEQPQHQFIDAFAEADTAFHYAIARMSGNSALSELYRYFSHSVRENILSVIDRKDLPEPDLLSHQAIVDAIENQDSSGAAAAVQAVVAPIIVALGNHKD
ncbi:FadR/GntR family transcriptional regulator [Enterobacter hormaechei]|uniref:FadR/GntR family transcriptional regulator n=1 Tax=Enterobacter ludwigii TaxID=299767 RepID=A0AAX3LIX4_9ENTR|nr:MULTISPECIES: FadR/GntR family transcriptional regulator [Enterobacter cloacae complex]WCE15999.1 FadR/GntR family transcriptional regulator [Enterobacter ludwigii]